MEIPPSSSPRRKYTWPWIVLAFVTVWILITVLWVANAAKKVEREHDYSAPLPTNAPVR